MASMAKQIAAILMRVWIAYLTWRYIKWGPSEGVLMFSFCLLEAARMIAGSLVERQVEQLRARPEPVKGDPQARRLTIHSV
jgi:hypothetical protein